MSAHKLKLRKGKANRLLLQVAHDMEEDNLKVILDNSLPVGMVLS